MTLQSSGAISLANVNTELGRSSTANISLGESAVRTLAGIASGTISLSSLYGKSNEAITLTSASAVATKVGSGVAVASLALRGTGDVYRSINGAAAVDVGDWLTPKSAATTYQVYATSLNGIATSNIMFSTWYTFTTGLEFGWSVARGVAGENDDAVTLQFRKVNTTTVVATATLYLTAIKEL